MRLCDIDPFVRFAATVTNGTLQAYVRVTDCRIFYVEAGSGQLYIGQNRYGLEKNTLFYCCGGGEYRVEREGNLQLMCVNFDLTRQYAGQHLPLPVSTRPEEWQEMPVYMETVEDSPFLNSSLVLPDGAGYYPLLSQLAAEFAENSPLSLSLCSCLLKTLLLRLHRQEQRQLPPKVELVLEYIRSHYHEDLTNERLGQLVGYHAYHLNRLFHRYMGMHLHGYLLKVRMERAAYLLLNTDLSLTDISESVGIHSYPYFSSAFKSRYGYAPAQYRKHLRGRS